MVGTVLIIGVHDVPGTLGQDVTLNGLPLGYRPYDGSTRDEITQEITQALADMLRERLGWPLDAPEDQLWD